MTNYDSTEQETAGKPLGLFARLQEIWQDFIAWIWQDSGPGEHRLRTLPRAFIRILVILFREFQRDGLTLRASALTFTVVLSLVPLLALGTAVLKGLGAGGQMRQAAYSFIEQIEEAPVVLQIDPPEQKEPGQVSEVVSQDVAGVAGEEVADESGTAQEESLTVHLRRAVDQVFDYVDKTDFATLGAFGIFGLLIAVLSFLGSIEQSMNAIWQVESNRPFGRKIIDYLALIILLPLTVNLVVATQATLQSPSLLGRFQDFLPVLWVGRFLLKMLPILLVVGTCTLLYRFLPNAPVKAFPALVGGICGGVGWFATQAVYISLQVGVARYNAIYGSFATLPLFLLWIYVGWVIFLLGAETAFAVQNWRHYLRHDVLMAPVSRLALAFTIIERCLVDFQQQRITEYSALVEYISQPEANIRSVLRELAAKGVLRRVKNGKNGYVPAAPAEEISAPEIINIILGYEAPPLQGARLAADALDGARAALQGRNIMHSGNKWPGPTIVSSPLE